MLLVFSIGITLVDVHLNGLNSHHLLILVGGLLVIFIDCIIFLSPFLDITRMSMSTVYFLAHLEWNALNYNLNGFKSRIKRHRFTVSSF